MSDVHSYKFRTPRVHLKWTRMTLLRAFYTRWRGQQPHKCPLHPARASSPFIVALVGPNNFNLISSNPKHIQLQRHCDCGAMRVHVETPFLWSTSLHVLSHQQLTDRGWACCTKLWFLLQTWVGGGIEQEKNWSFICLAVLQIASWLRSVLGIVGPTAQNP